MPLLAPEPACFPADLLSDQTVPTARPGRWWAVYTKAKAEKALARHLRGRSVAHYLPLGTHTWKNKGRTFTSQLPLFPGYVFVYGDEDQRVTALESNLISKILDVPDQRRLYADLRRVDRMLAAEVPVDMVEALVPGQPIRITAGPFEGLEGTLLHQRGQLRLVVEVAFLRQAVSVEVEGWMVEPASRAAACPA